jgi:hypothetical protein
LPVGRPNSCSGDGRPKRSSTTLRLSCRRSTSGHASFLRGLSATKLPPVVPSATTAMLPAPPALPSLLLLLLLPPLVPSDSGGVAGGAGAAFPPAAAAAAACSGVARSPM